MHDPGDEHTNGATPSGLHDEGSEGYYRDRKITLPEVPGAPLHVTEPRAIPLSGALARRRFTAMSLKLQDVARLLAAQALELDNGIPWTEEARREWMGKLRRLGIDLDTYLSSSLP